MIAAGKKMVGVGVFGHTASLRDDGATHARRETPSVRRERARAAMVAMNAYVMRHAESTNNALGAATIENDAREHDPGLTARGEAQCARVRARGGASASGAGEVDGGDRASREVEVWSSPMRRCLMTADALARGLGVRFGVRGDLHEHGGCFRGARGGAGDGGGVVGLPGMTKAEMEDAFPACDVPMELEHGWWSPERGCESVRDAQERARGTAEWLWARARAMNALEEPAKDLYIVAHGMFIDMLFKTLFNVPRTSGKQPSLFCSQNACVHKLRFDVAEDGESVGLQMFNDVTHIPEHDRSGGSVEGLDVAYTKEGSA